MKGTRKRLSGEQGAGRDEASGANRGSSSPSSKKTKRGSGTPGDAGGGASGGRSGLVKRQKGPAVGASGQGSGSGSGGGPRLEGHVRHRAVGVGSGGGGDGNKISSSKKSGGAAAREASTAGRAGGSSAPSGSAAAGIGGLAATAGADGGGAAADELATYSVGCEVPAAARPWLSAHHRTAGQSSVTVYGRAPDGTVRPYGVTLTPGWRLSGTGHLAADLGIKRGDVLRFRREMVAAAGSGAAGGDMGVVVEKAAGLPQQEEPQPQEEEEDDAPRAPRTEVHVGPLVDPAGPAAGRVVVSDEHKFHDGGTTIVLRRHVIPHLLDAARIQQAVAQAASDGGCTQRYVVTLYARWAGEVGPPLAFGGIHLTPCGRGVPCPTWLLTCLRPLHEYLELGPRAPVLLVREVGQDGRVRLVVEHRQSGRRGKRKEVAAPEMEAAATQAGAGGEASGGGGHAGSGKEGAFLVETGGDGEQSVGPSDGGGRSGAEAPSGVTRKAEGNGVHCTEPGSLGRQRGPGGQGSSGPPGALAAEGAREDVEGSGKRQRLGAPAGLDDGTATGAAEGKDVLPAQQHGLMDAQDPAARQEAVDAQEEQMLDVLEAHVESTQGALQQAKARAAALEGQLQVERERAEAARVRFRRGLEYQASVLRRLGLPVDEPEGHGQQVPPQPSGQDVQQQRGTSGAGDGGGAGAGSSGAVGRGTGKERRADGWQLEVKAEMPADRPAAAQHGAAEGEDVHPAPQQQEMGDEEERIRFHTDMLAAHLESTRGALEQAQARAAALEGLLASERAKAAQELERERVRAAAAEGHLHRTQERLGGVLRRMGLPAEGVPLPAAPAPAPA